MGYIFQKFWQWGAYLLAVPYVAESLTFCAALGSIAGFMKFINAINERKVQQLSRKLLLDLKQNGSIDAFTYEDVAHACKSYIEPDCAQLDPSDENDLRNIALRAPLFMTVENHLARGGESRHIILLADSGMGKTSFCLNYYSREVKKAEKGRQVAIIPLGRGDGLTRIAAFKRSRNDAILFLDAFDEDPEAVDNQKERLEELLRAASDFRNIIVTCRSQFFASDADVPTGSGIMYVAAKRAGQGRELPLHRVFLAPFSEKQISLYVRKNFPYTKVSNWRWRRSARRLVKEVPELAVRPMLLELLPDLVREKRKVEQLFSLYEYLVDKWLEREAGWIEPQVLLDISIELAVRAFVRQRSGGGDRLGAEEVDCVASSYKYPLESWKIRSRSLLNRDIEGLYKFAHRSVMEYLFLLAAMRGEQRCCDVEWTDLIKDLFVSWGSVPEHGFPSVVFSMDLSRTGLFPLATPVREPKRVSHDECKVALQSDGISLRRSGKIPADWRNDKLRVDTNASAGCVAICVQDSAQGLIWLGVDVSSLGGETRSLYKDSFTTSESNVLLVNFGLPGEFVKRLPSLDELITLWESEPYIRERYHVSIFESFDLYWLGDTGDSGPLCCSFGESPLKYERVRHVGTRSGKYGRKLHLYEFQYRYGIVKKASYKAMCVYVAEEIGSASTGSGLGENRVRE